MFCHQREVYCSKKVITTAVCVFAGEAAWIYILKVFLLLIVNVLRRPMSDWFF